MIVALALAIDLRINQTFWYQTDWIPMKGEKVSLPWKIVTKAKTDEGYLLTLQQGDSEPVEWSIFRNGALQSRPPTAAGIPTKIWRILEGLLPSPPGEKARSRSWMVDFFSSDDTEEDAALFVDIGKKASIFSYREGSKAFGLGDFKLDRKLPLPSQLSIAFQNDTSFLLRYSSKPVYSKPPVHDLKKPGLRSIP